MIKMRPFRLSRTAARLVAAVLLTVHGFLLLGILRANFVTLDEVGHLPAGLSHWQTGTFSMYQVNPPLPRMISVLPVLLAHPITDYRLLSHAPGMRSEWIVSPDFVTANSERYFDFVCLARLSGVLWSLLGGWLVFRWSRELYGDAAGCLALTLWCFDPNILAFAPLVLPDLPATVACLGATYVYCRYLKRPSLFLACAAGVLLGVAELTKFTLLVLYVAWPIIWLIHRPDRRSCEGVPHHRATFAAHACVIVILSLLTINLGYGFRETFLPLSDYGFVSRTLGGEPPSGAFEFTNGLSGNRFRGTWLGDVVIPLPADFLRGIDVQRRDFEHGFASYLGCRWQSHGWWYYYLYAMGVKVPLGTLALVLVSLALTLTRRLGSFSRADELTLLTPAILILVFVSSQTGFNHHMRYVLPIFPFLMIGAGKLALCTDRWRGVPLIVMLLGWMVVSSLFVYPHDMSYFNEAAGGPERGDEHLLDSNIDWGQDLLFLKRWLDEHPEARPLGLAYFNNRIDPRMVGIEFHLPPPKPNGLFPDDLEYQKRFGPQPGFYAVSVNLMRGLTYSIPDGHGGWRFTTNDDYAYFRQFKPVARAGYSIRIYHITRQDMDRMPPLKQGIRKTKGDIAL